MFEAVIAELSQVSPAGWSRRRLDAALGELGRLRGAVDAFEAGVLAAIDGLDDGGLGAESSIRSRQRCSRRAARRKAHRAAALADMPNTTAALAGGRISVEHVDDLVRAAGDTSPGQVDESALVPAEGPARPADLAARDVRDWVRSRQSINDRHRAHLRRRAARELSMFVGDDDMVVLSGRFDPVTGAQIRSVLEAETDRLWRLDGGRGEADQIRTVTQRRADALHNLLCAQARAGRQGPRAGRDRPGAGGGGGGGGGGDAGTGGDSTRCPTRHQILVIASIDTITGTDPNSHCEIPGTGTIPTSELQRLACNSELAGTVFGTRGEILWHGRRHRRVTEPQWRALIARDRGCVRCGAPPSRCEAHHLIPWAAGGPTNIDNLALVCIRCHHELHDHHLTLHPPDHTHPDWHTTTDQPP